MKRFLGATAGLIVGLAAVAAFAAFGGDSSASTPPPSQDAGQTDQQALSGDIVAVAIGQLDDSEGEGATVDLRASRRNGRTGGSFRFFSHEYGYYNGGVRVLWVRDGVIHVAGAGGLFPPEGGRIQVRYQATFSTLDDSAEVTVTGPEGREYTMTGTVDGLVTVGRTPVVTPAASS